MVLWVRQCGVRLRPQEFLRLLLMTIRLMPESGVNSVECVFIIMRICLSCVRLYRLKCLLSERCERRTVMLLLKWSWKCFMARVASETLGMRMTVSCLCLCMCLTVLRQILAPFEFAMLLMSMMLL